MLKLRVILLVCMLYCIVPEIAIAGPADTGFLPGEWRITSTTTMPGLPATTMTHDQCLHSAGGATYGMGQVSVPKTSGNIQNTITRQPNGDVIWQGGFDMLTDSPNGGSTMEQKLTQREIYTRDPLKRAVMTGSGVLKYSQGNHTISTLTDTEHGYWLSPKCAGE